MPTHLPANSHDAKARWRVADRRRCVICGEDAYQGGSGAAEMHDPEDSQERGGLVHADCGLSRGWVIS